MKVYSTFILASIQNSIIYDSDFFNKIVLYMFCALKEKLDGRKEDYKEPKSSCLSFEMKPT